ncbi:2-succinylbenzoate--CoA ligase [Leptolyngbya sp. AN02str]|uniref:2-succinylbenzoate--CoA ligase n=1 Tax=Leptolyngbya sp. AN02str TaxID=3423363 RepID=UPI003D31C223
MAIPPIPIECVIQQRLTEDWVIGLGDHDLSALVQQRLEAIAPSTAQTLVLLAEPDPLQTLAAILAAGMAQCSIALGNPLWTVDEWQQAIALVQPSHVWADVDLPLPALWNRDALKQNDGDRPWPASLQNEPLILIPTGGSSGRVKFAMHTWDTLAASVWGFRQHFGCDRVHACCVLPLYHVSGFMQLLRSLLTGGSLALHSAKALTAGELPAIDPAHYFLSLVPTQLQRLLQQPALVGWLPQVRTILLGGAPPWPALLDEARQHHLNLALTYGMTETASQIVTQHPHEFFAGLASCGTPLPHARLSIRDAAGNPLPQHRVGTVHVQATSLMLGYFPQPFAHPWFATDDVGYVDHAGRLHVVGRSSDKIITGGENVFAGEVEAAIRATHLVLDVVVLGMRDRHWGEVVTACYVPMHPTVTVPELAEAVGDRLSRYKCPKHWILLDAIPRNAQGKVNRAVLQSMAATAYQNLEKT